VALSAVLGLEKWPMWGGAGERATGVQRSIKEAGVPSMLKEEGTPQTANLNELTAALQDRSPVGLPIKPLYSCRRCASNRWRRVCESR